MVCITMVSSIVQPYDTERGDMPREQALVLRMQARGSTETDEISFFYTPAGIQSRNLVARGPHCALLHSAWPLVQLCAARLLELL